MITSFFLCKALHTKTINMPCWLPPRDLQNMLSRQAVISTGTTASGEDQHMTLQLSHLRSACTNLLHQLRLPDLSACRQCWSRSLDAAAAAAGHLPNARRKAQENCVVDIFLGGCQAQDSPIDCLLMYAVFCCQKSTPASGLGVISNMTCFGLEILCGV